MYPKAVYYVSVLAPSAIHAEFEAPPKCRISLQSPAFSRFQPLKSPTRFHEDPEILAGPRISPSIGSPFSVSPLAPDSDPGNAALPVRSIESRSTGSTCAVGVWGELSFCILESCC